MTTPSDTIAASNINTELGRASNTSLNMNERVIRQLANSVINANMSPASTSISFDNLRSKSRVQTQTLSSGTVVQRDITGENLFWNLGATIPPSIARWDVGSGSEWTSLGGDIQTDSLDIQFDPTSALRADPSNWAITSSGATYGIRVTISGTRRNLGLGSRILVAFFDRSGIGPGAGSTWSPPDTPINYSYITEHENTEFNLTEQPFTISSEIVAQNINPALQASSPLEWTLTRLKTYGANNYLSIICAASPWLNNESMFKISSISITVQTQIN